MAVWGDVAGVAEMEPRGVPVWTRGWACLRRVVGLRGWGNGRSGLGGGGLGFVGERGGVFEESPLMSEMGQGLELEWLVLGLASRSGLWLVVEPEPHPSEDGPLPAERIRRSWEAGKLSIPV